MWLDKTAAAITPLDVKELFSQFQAQGRSHAFKVRLKYVITGVFNYAIERGLIKGMTKPPTYRVKLERAQEKKPEILNLTEIKRLLLLAKQYQNPWYPVWSMALLTGMRNGELYALRWEDVSFETKSITVARSYNKRTRDVKSTKAGYWRTVPISGELYELLVELKATAGVRPYVLPRVDQWERGCQAEELRKFCSLTKLPSIRFHALSLLCHATN